MTTIAQFNEQYARANTNAALDKLLRAAERQARRIKHEQEQRQQDELFGLMMDLAKDADVAGIYAATGYLPPLLRAIK